MDDNQANDRFDKLLKAMAEGSPPKPKASAKSDPSKHDSAEKPHEQ